MFDLGKILDFFKLTWKSYLIIFLACTTLIFVGEKARVVLGTNKIINEYRYIVGIVLVISASALIVKAIEVLVFNLRKYIKIFRFKRELLIQIDRLTPGERDIVLKYIEKNSRTIKLYVADGDVCRLEQIGFISRMTVVGDCNLEFPYVISERLWDCLKSNPRIIENWRKE